MDLSNEKDFEKFVKDTIAYYFENLTSRDFEEEFIEPSNYVEFNKESISTEADIKLMGLYTSGHRLSNKAVNKHIDFYINSVEKELADDEVAEDWFLDSMQDILANDGLWLDIGARLTFLPTYYHEYPECHVNLKMLLKDDRGVTLEKYEDYGFKIGSHVKVNVVKLSEDDFVEDTRDSLGVLANEVSLVTYIENQIQDYISRA